MGGLAGGPRSRVDQDLYPCALCCAQATAEASLVKWVRQDSFEESSFDAGGLNVHAHSETRSRTLIILIHGLNGRGYRTWGNLPEFLFECLEPTADVALYDYRSGARLLLGNRGGFRHWVGQIADHLRDLVALYDHVFLVGHSQGGLIAEDAARLHLSVGAIASSGSGSPSVTPRQESLAGLILLGSPRAGSMWVSSLVAWITPIFAPLKAFGRRSAECDEFYSSFVERQNTTYSTRKFILPTYAAIAGGDMFVAEFSAAFGVPAGQKKRLSTTHTGIVKPPSPDAEVVQWLSSVTHEVLEVRAQALRERAHRLQNVAPSVDSGTEHQVVAELQSDTSGLAYEEAYFEQCLAASQPGVAVVDARDAGMRVVDVLLAAHDSGRFLAGHPTVKASVDRAHKRRIDDSARSVSICPIGPRSEEAKEIVDDWLAGKAHSPSLFVTALPDIDGFREHLARMLNGAITRKLGSRRTRVVSREREDYVTTGGDEI